MFKSKHCIIFSVATTALVSYAYSSDDLGILALKAFEQDVRPVLEKHCFNCHGPEKQKGKVRLDTLNPDLVNSTSAETWHDALDNINLGEMPPEDEPAISDQDRRVLTDWISGELKRASEARRSTGGKTVLRRLNRYEYANTLRDLLGLDLDFARTLPPSLLHQTALRTTEDPFECPPNNLSTTCRLLGMPWIRLLLKGRLL